MSSCNEGTDVSKDDTGYSVKESAGRLSALFLASGAKTSEEYLADPARREELAETLASIVEPVGTFREAESAAPKEIARLVVGAAASAIGHEPDPDGSERFYEQFATTDYFKDLMRELDLIVAQGSDDDILDFLNVLDLDKLTDVESAILVCLLYSMAIAEEVADDLALAGVGAGRNDILIHGKSESSSSEHSHSEERHENFLTDAIGHALFDPNPLKMALTGYYSEKTTKDEEKAAEKAAKEEEKAAEKAAKEERKETIARNKEDEERESRARGEGKKAFHRTMAKTLALVNGTQVFGGASKGLSSGVKGVAKKSGGALLKGAITAEGAETLAEGAALAGNVLLVAAGAGLLGGLTAAELAQHKAYNDDLAKPQRFLLYSTGLRGSYA